MSAGGVAAVLLNEWIVRAEIARDSGGMVAFADMVWFVLVAGVLGLVPTWMLLERNPT